VKVWKWIINRIIIRLFATSVYRIRWSTYLRKAGVGDVGVNMKDRSWFCTAALISHNSPLCCGSRAWLAEALGQTSPDMLSLSCCLCWWRDPSLLESPWWALKQKENLWCNYSVADYIKRQRCKKQPTFSLARFKRREHLEDLCVDWTTTLKWILLDVRMWTGFHLSLDKVHWRYIMNALMDPWIQFHHLLTMTEIRLYPEPVQSYSRLHDMMYEKLLFS
jgi:hypothetical protein